MKKVVLLLNMGGADNLSEVEVFLTNMFNDPYILGIKSALVRRFVAFMITKARLKTAKSNYKKLGGKSPIGDITRSLVKKLNENYGSDEIKFDYIMNYTPPFAMDTLSKYKNFDDITLFALYPHHSKTTVSSSLDSTNLAIKKLGIDAKVKIIEPFFCDDSYNEIIAQSIKKSVLGEDTSKIDLIFSAHSLPQKIIDGGDLYEKHVRCHVEILSKMLSELRFKSITLAYQSKLGPIKWLEPNLSEVLPNLSGKRAVIYPISFCIDNSETDFELDMEYRLIANEHKFDLYKVVKAPNDTDEFARFIASKSV